MITHRDRELNAEQLIRKATHSQSPRGYIYGEEVQLLASSFVLFTRNETQPSPPKPIKVNSVETDGKKIYITGTKRQKMEYEEGMVLDPMEIDVDPSVLGLPTTNLIPDTPPRQYDQATQNTYNSLMKSVNLPVFDGGTLSEAKIDPRLRSVTFGCEIMPINLLKTTLETLWKTETNLCELNISWKCYANRTLTAIDLDTNLMASKTSPLVHVWALPGHDDSVFGMVDLDEYKEDCENCEKDNVDIYVHLSEDKKRIAVLSLSDYALSLNCGRAQYGKYLFPAMMAAFSTVTTSDVSYEIREEALEQKINEVINVHQEVKEVPDNTYEYDEGANYGTAQ